MDFHIFLNCFFLPTDQRSRNYTDLSFFGSKFPLQKLHPNQTFGPGFFVVCTTSTSKGEDFDSHAWRQPPRFRRLTVPCSFPALPGPRVELRETQDPFLFKIWKPSGCFLMPIYTQRIHVWYIYLHLVDFQGKCK